MLPSTFAAAMHSYFEVAGIDKAEVNGLDKILDPKLFDRKNGGIGCTDHFGRDRSRCTPTPSARSCSTWAQGSGCRSRPKDGMTAWSGTTDDHGGLLQRVCLHGERHGLGYRDAKRHRTYGEPGQTSLSWT